MSRPRERPDPAILSSMPRTNRWSSKCIPLSHHSKRDPTLPSLCTKDMYKDMQHFMSSCTAATQETQQEARCVSDGSQPITSSDAACHMPLCTPTPLGSISVSSPQSQACPAQPHSPRPRAAACSSPDAPAGSRVGQREPHPSALLQLLLPRQRAAGDLVERALARLGVLEFRTGVGREPGEDLLDLLQKLRHPLAPRRPARTAHSHASARRGASRRQRRRGGAGLGGAGRGGTCLRAAYAARRAPSGRSSRGSCAPRPGAASTPPQRRVSEAGRRGARGAAGAVP
jgi:hypothetical protein